MKPHILVINNDPAVLSMFRDLLDDEGYRVTTRLYTDKDMTTMFDLTLDAIILDYMWASDDSGWSMLQLIRMDPRLANLPVVLCTGAVREVHEMADQLALMGVRVLLKPFNITQLRTLLLDIFAPAVMER